MSFALVIIVILLQVFFQYLLYNSNVDLLQKEVNEVAHEAYQRELTLRMSACPDVDSSFVYNWKAVALAIPEGMTVRAENTSAEDGDNIDKSFSMVNLVMEETLGKDSNVNLSVVDSIATALFSANGTTVSLYSELVDPSTNKILSTTLSRLDQSNRELFSEYILLNINGDRALRLVVSNPVAGVFSRMLIPFLLSLVLCLICIYNLNLYRNEGIERRESAQMKNETFMDFFHEFKKPLSVMLQVTSALEKEKVIQDKGRRELYLKIANKEVLKMSEQAEMILTIAMDNEGVLNLNYSEFDVEDMVTGSVRRLMNFSTELSDIKIINTLDNPVISGDQNLLEQAVNNLLTNAIKYSGASVSIEILLYCEDGKVCISVKDNGVGIAKEDIPFIFDRYYRSQNTSGVKGHGIGLSFVKRIAERHKGDIVVKSDLGKGSEFIIQLPYSNKV